MLFGLLPSGQEHEKRFGQIREDMTLGDIKSFLDRVHDQILLARSDRVIVIDVRDLLVDSLKPADSIFKAGS